MPDVQWAPHTSFSSVGTALPPLRALVVRVACYKDKGQSSECFVVFQNKMGDIVACYLALQ